MASCPTPKKRRLSEAAAVRAAISLSRKMGYGIRSYRCACGAWHTTRWQYSDKAANLAALRESALREYQEEESDDEGA